MIITGKRLSRRAVLRASGACLALPWLDAMIPALGKAATPTAPRRFVLFYCPNGMIMPSWTPKGEGTDFTFGPTLEPLTPFREKILVLGGLDRPQKQTARTGPHAAAGGAYLTGSYARRLEVRAEASVDQIISEKVGRDTVFSSLELGTEEPDLSGICDMGGSCAYTNTLSWRDATTPLPSEVNPRSLFERMFGIAAETTDPVARRARLARQQTVLDAVREQISGMKSKLGPADTSKLNQYLETVRDIERRIQIVEKDNSSNPGLVLERAAGIPESFDEHVRLMIDLQIAALQNDMTRVIVFMIARELTDRSYPSIGIHDAHHQVSHHGNDPEKIAKVAKINRLFMEKLAYYMDRLQGTPELGQTLFDQTLMVGGASIADSNAHSPVNLPVLLAGGAGGQIQGGRHIKFPAGTPLNNLWVSVMQMMGVEQDHFGDSTGRLDGLKRA